MLDFIAPILSANQSPSFAFSKFANNAPGGSIDVMSVPSIIVFMVILVISIILVATFWSAPNQDRLKRQRKYARVDDLYFPLIGVSASPEALSDISKLNGDMERIGRYIDTFLPIEMRLTSLSLGGCAVKTDKEFEKGQQLILNLSLLPDYPEPHDYIAFKVAWVRSPKKTTEDSRFEIGLQISDVYSPASKQNVKNYLNYLLDEPAA